MSDLAEHEQIRRDTAPGRGSSNVSPARPVILGGMLSGGRGIELQVAPTRTLRAELEPAALAV